MASPTLSSLKSKKSLPLRRRFNLSQVVAALVTIYVPAALLVELAAATPVHGVLAWVAPLSLLSVPCVISYLAYFHYVPEIAGGKSSSPLPLAVRWLYWLRTSGLVLITTGVIITLSDHFAYQRTWEESLVFVGIGVPLGYAIATAFCVLNRFAAPAPWPSDYAPKASRLHQAVDHCGWPARWLARRMKPRFCASWGSLAVLLSLVFITSENFACSTDRTRGYEVLTTKNTWITAINFDRETFSFFADAAGKVFYSLALLVAIVVLVRYVRRPTIAGRERKIVSSLVDGIGWATLFFLTDVSLLAWLDTPLWIAYGLVPVALWLWFHRSPKWILVRSFLVVLYLPIVVWSYFVLLIVISESVIGYVLLFFGSQLMWLGLTQIARDANDSPVEKGTAAKTGLVPSP